MSASLRKMYVCVVHRHVHATKHVSSVIPDTNCSLYMTAEATREEVHLFRGNADHKVRNPSKAPPLHVAVSDVFGIY